MQIVETLTWANNKLKDHGVIDAPMLDAQLLLCLTLDVPKNYLFSHFDQRLTAEQLNRFESLVDRRGHHEPMAYILGWKDFYGRPFKVNPFVLIPRPETETLVEAAIKAAEQEHDVLFVDVGTGSGAIAVTLAAETGRPVIGTEVSARALKVAEQNAKIHRAADRITFLGGNLIEPIDRQLTHSIDHVILIANLPYLTSRQYAETAPEVHDYEPKMALDGGVDGLEVYNELFRELQDRRGDFPSKLTVLIEIDPDQKYTAPKLIEQYFPQSRITVLPDLQNRPRVVVAELGR